MAEIWRLTNQTGIGSINYVHKPEQEIVFDGTKLGLRWVSVPFKWVDSDTDYEQSVDERRAVDSPMFDFGVIACSALCWEKIQPYVEVEVEALPITLEEKPYFLINITNIVDCLDKEKSEITKFGNGKPMVRSYYFNTEKVREHYLFKVPESPWNKIFATSKFKNLIKDLGVTGLDFQDPNYKPGFMS